MTNEEAFEKFWEDRQAKGLDAANRREYEESWNAAIAYMQEQSEPVAWIETDCIGERYLCFSKPNSSNQIIPLFTTPQRQQPLKRLDDKAIGDCLNKAELPTIMLNPILTKKLGNFANAIMGEMERINRG